MVSALIMQLIQCGLEGDQNTQSSEASVEVMNAPPTLSCHAMPYWGQSLTSFALLPC